MHSPTCQVIGLTDKISRAVEARIEIYVATVYATGEIVDIGEVSHDCSLKPGGTHAFIDACQTECLLVVTEQIYFCWNFQGMHDSSSSILSILYS